MRSPPTIDEIAAVLEAAWSSALPGKESCERDSVLRELQRDLRQRLAVEPPRLRLVRTRWNAC
jgi:hypothetical protein